MPPSRRLPLAALVAALLLLGIPAASAGDPRGSARVYEAPGFAGDPAAKVVSLTFDDGPHPKYTPIILDILRDKGVKATFFMVGREAERYPELVQRVVAEGHVIGNHTWDHPRLQGMAEGPFSQQVDRTTEVLESISGQGVACTRPPYGDAKPDTVARLAARGQASIVWSADSQDFEKPGSDAIIRNSLKGLTPGGIILLHDGGGVRDQTIAALPQLIDRIVAAGYTIGPVCDGRPRHPDGYVDLAASESPESIHVAGWTRDPDAIGPSNVRVSLDGAIVHEGPASGERADGAGGFDLVLPTTAGPHTVCATAMNVGPGADKDLGCHAVEALEAPWYDRLGRYLGLLDGGERFETPRGVASDPLNELMDTLVPKDRP